MTACSKAAESGINTHDIKLQWIVGIVVYSIVLVAVVIFWNRRMNRNGRREKNADVQHSEDENRFREIMAEADDFNKKMIETSPTGICICDETGQFNQVNESMGRIAGNKWEHLLNRNYHDMESWNQSGISTNADAALKDGTVRRQETRITTDSGQKKAIDCFFVPFSRRGKKHLMVMVTDIMERKRFEKTLRESEKKYRYLFNNAPAGMYEIDFNTLKFTNVTPVMCKYTGYSEEEMLTMNPLDLLPKDSLDRFVKRLDEVARGEALPDNVEYEIIKKNGDIITVLLNCDFVKEGDTIVGAQVVAHDITELKRVEKEKIEAQKIADEQNKMALVGQIAGKMAHDFNNILSIILGTTELAMLDTEDKEVKRSLDLILEQAIRGKNLTKNLVIFAKDHEPRQEFFLIQNKIKLVLDLLKKDLEGIKVIYQEDNELPLILADPGMIEHALVNLVQNAIHALSRTASPKIWIRLWTKDDRICLSIKDNGCGIPKDHLSRIYEPAFTLKGSCDISGAYKKGIKGTGYGMSNVKKYIEQHHGRIEVESIEGEETCFLIYLPTTKEELTEREIVDLKKEKTFSGQRILLVEDETPVSNIQKKILSQPPCSHKVDVVKDAATALEMFMQHPYDLVSLDYILLGEMNGMDVYHQIRKTDKTVPILFISGNIEFLESIRRLKQKDLFIDHLSKPCLNSDYIKHINRLLDKISRN